MNARVAPSPARPGALATLGSSAVYLTDPVPFDFDLRIRQEPPDPGVMGRPPTGWCFLMHRTRNGTKFSRCCSMQFRFSFMSDRASRNYRMNFL